MNGCCRLESGSVKIFSGADAGHLAVGPAFSLVDDGLILVTSQLCVSNVGMPLQQSGNFPPAQCLCS